MPINGKQHELNGIDRVLSGRSLADHIRRSFTDRGLKTLAAEIDSDHAELSRFQCGQGGMTLSKLDKILEQEGLIIVRKEEILRILAAWMLSTEMMHRLLRSDSHES